jgi:hypothetical protein
MTEHEKARLEAAIARGKLNAARNAPREALNMAAANRDRELDTNDGYAPSRIILQKKPASRR